MSLAWLVPKKHFFFHNNDIDHNDSFCVLRLSKGGFTGLGIYHSDKKRQGLFSLKTCIVKPSITISIKALELNHVKTALKHVSLSYQKKGSIGGLPVLLLVWQRQRCLGGFSMTQHSRINITMPFDYV